MNKKTKPNLSPRDLKVCRLIAEQGPIRTTTIQRYLQAIQEPTDPRKVRRICEKLEKLKYIQREQILSGSTIVWPTPKALRLADIASDSIPHRSKPSMTSILHSIYVAEVRAIYESNGAEWICERRLKGRFPNHLPDGLAHHEGSDIIVEIDRTRKGQDRLVNIFKLNLTAYSSLVTVDYWVPKDLYDFMNASRSLLPSEMQGMLRVFQIPEDLL